MCRILLRDPEIFIVGLISPEASLGRKCKTVGQKDSADQIFKKI
jgi:hypothetical protein